jgi:hypothetical protein
MNRVPAEQHTPAPTGLFPNLRLYPGQSVRYLRMRGNIQIVNNESEKLKRRRIKQKPNNKSHGGPVRR